MLCGANDFLGGGLKFKNIMKKITITKVKNLLKVNSINEIQGELILNNVMLFNDLIDQYENESKHNSYLIYQVSLQLYKMIQGIVKEENINEEQQDQFLQMINKIKPKKETR